MYHTINNNNCGRFTYSVEQEVESLETFCLDTYLSELAKSRTIPEPSCSNDNATESCQSSQSGTTSKLSMEDRGAAQLTFFAGGSRVKTSAQQEKELEFLESVAVCGRNMRDLLKRYNLDLSLPKTRQCYALEDYEQSSQTYPVWGMMRDGVFSVLAMSVRHINETEYGYLPRGVNIPTPTASDGTTGAIISKGDTYRKTKSGMPRKVNRHGTDGSVGLGRLVQMWPTPCATDYKGSGKTGQLRDRLDYAIERGATKSNVYPTPQVDDAKNSGNGGQLNPTWVEWLIGWPIGWTDLKPLGTDRLQLVRRWRGEF